MSEIHDWIAKARETLGLVRSAFEEMSVVDARKIVSDAMALYVQGNPQSWWQSLRGHYEVVPPQKGGFKGRLSQLMPTGQQDCYFIPETGEEDLRVYRGSMLTICAVIDDCPFFEYYILAPDLSWLAIENDHNALIIARADRPQ
jgi:hypothetical protein